MAIVLFRVDERLIHGQVVVGWGTVLHPDVFVVVDDELAESGWEQELYCLGLPPQMEARFVSVAQAREQLPAWQTGWPRILVLTRNVHTMRRLFEGAALPGVEVNIGGLHFAPGRRAVLPYVYLSDEERDDAEALAAGGVSVSARDLPTTRATHLAQLLGSE
jgi:PTS system mannose-specific IIB component/fructoselysine and glucoselysine-specific PTS system IIB component